MLTPNISTVILKNTRVTQKTMKMNKNGGDFFIFDKKKNKTKQNIKVQLSPVDKVLEFLNWFWLSTFSSLT